MLFLIPGIAHSRRPGVPTNPMARDAAQQLAREGIRNKERDLGNGRRTAHVVTELKAAIRAAGGHFPAHRGTTTTRCLERLKRAIDWASRPYGDSVWNGKAAIMGGPGQFGTVRAPAHLQQDRTLQSPSRADSLPWNASRQVVRSSLRAGDTASAVGWCSTL